MALFIFLFFFFLSKLASSPVLTRGNIHVRITRRNIGGGGGARKSLSINTKNYFTKNECALDQKY